MVDPLYIKVQPHLLHADFSVGNRSDIFCLADLQRHSLNRLQFDHTCHMGQYWASDCK